MLDLVTCYTYHSHSNDLKFQQSIFKDNFQWVQSPGVDLGGGAKAKFFFFFLDLVMLHIKLKLTPQAATWKQIFCPQTHPQPCGWGQKVKPFIFWKLSHVAYQIKGNWAKSIMKANGLSLHTPSTPGLGSKSLFFYLKVVKLHIKLKWKKCRPTCKLKHWLYTHPWSLGLGWKVRYRNFADKYNFY